MELAYGLFMISSFLNLIAVVVGSLLIYWSVGKWSQKLTGMAQEIAAQRAIHRKLNLFLDTVMNHPQLTSTLVPLGDGVILITKEADSVILEEPEKG